MAFLEALKPRLSLTLAKATPTEVRGEAGLKNKVALLPVPVLSCHSKSGLKTGLKNKGVVDLNDGTSRPGKSQRADAL